MSILRDLFLAMSTNALMRRFVVGFPLSRRVSRRFVAGETVDEAIQVVKKLRGQGIDVTFDQLGESVTNEAEARAAKDGYLRALDAIATNKVTSQVSVKLTQMGLELNPDLCLDNMRQILRRAQEVGLQGVHAGMSGVEADRIVRDVIEAAGYGDNFGHGLGHGVGLAVHVGPRAGRTSEDTLLVGSTLTIEPGIYISGWGGVRIEDLTRIGENGVQLLSCASKEPLVLQHP